MKVQFYDRKGLHKELEIHQAIQQLLTKTYSLGPEIEDQVSDLEFNIGNISDLLGIITETLIEKELLDKNIIENYLFQRKNQFIEKISIT